MNAIECDRQSVQHTVGTKNRGVFNSIQDEGWRQENLYSSESAKAVLKDEKSLPGRLYI